MTSLSGKEFIKVLERRGWVLKRINGSHHIYAKSGTIVRLSIPIHGNKPLRIGLLKHLMKMAEIEDGDL